MKATVAYESPRKQKPTVRPLKFHRNKAGGLTAHGEKGMYEIVRQKPNRRLGIFKWKLGLHGADVVVKGAPMSLDDLSELKAFASSYDAMPPAVEVDIVVEENAKAGEAPTREEWEVVVTNPPAAHRGAILNMAGPGDGFEAGNKIILQGFHDDTQAANVGAAIAKRYRVQVTFGPKRAMEAAEAPARAAEGHICGAGCRHAHEGAHGASEAPRRRTEEERRFPLRWNDTPKGNSFSHGRVGTYATSHIATGRWALLGPNHETLGVFGSKQDAESEAERVEHLERRNTRMRSEYAEEDGGRPLV